MSESRNVGGAGLSLGLLLMVVAAGLGGIFYFWTPQRPAAVPSRPTPLPTATGERLNLLQQQANAVVDQNVDYLRENYPYGFAIAIRNWLNEDLYFFDSEYGTPVKVQPLPNRAEGLLEHQGLSNLYAIRFDLLQVSVADSLGSNEKFKLVSVPFLRVPTFPSLVPTPTGYSQEDSSGAVLDLTVELISQDEVILVIGFRKQQEVEAGVTPAAPP